MGRVVSSRVLTLAQLRHGHSLAIQHALDLWCVSAEVSNERPGVSLALSEMAQEEIGKALSLLAAASLEPTPSAFDWLWKTWKSHQLKAHRAFLYELIIPTRLELKSTSGDVLSGLPRRARISMEREIGLYVDFDDAVGEFRLPESRITTDELLNRQACAMSLATTAQVVYDALFCRDEDFRFSAFSEIATRICTENLYQQQMPSILDDFCNRSKRHKELIFDLRKLSFDAKSRIAEVIQGSRRSEVQRGAT